MLLLLLQLAKLVRDAPLTAATVVGAAVKLVTVVAAASVFSLTVVVRAVVWLAAAAVASEDTVNITVR